MIIFGKDEEGTVELKPIENGVDSGLDTNGINDPKDIFLFNASFHSKN